MRDERFFLTQGDKINPLWLALAEHLEKRLNTLRSANEGNLGESETANLRGRIAEIRSLLALAKDQPIIEQQ